jgi:hypothetical protein
VEIACPVCGNSGGAGDDQAPFEVRGNFEGKAIRKCNGCGTGLAVGPSGRVEVIPAPAWEVLDRSWARRFGAGTDRPGLAAKLPSGGAESVGRGSAGPGCGCCLSLLFTLLFFVCIAYIATDCARSTGDDSGGFSLRRSSGNESSLGPSLIATFEEANTAFGRLTASFERLQQRGLAPTERLSEMDAVVAASQVVADSCTRLDQLRPEYLQETRWEEQRRRPEYPLVADVFALDVPVTEATGEFCTHWTTMGGAARSYVLDYRQDYDELLAAIDRQGAASAMADADMLARHQVNMEVRDSTYLPIIRRSQAELERLLPRFEELQDRKAAAIRTAEGR